MYFVVDMPLNAEGNGPEMNPSLVTEVLWEIWDETFQLIASYATKTEADHQCIILNNESSNSL